MFKISTTRKHGGIWDGSRIVKVYETDNAEVAAALKAQGYTVEEYAVELDAMNVPQLKKYAKEHGIDLCGATQKELILNVIRAATAE